MAITNNITIQDAALFTIDSRYSTKTKLNDNFSLMNSNFDAIESRFEDAFDDIFGKCILSGMVPTVNADLTFSVTSGRALIGARVDCTATTVTVLASQTNAYVYFMNDGTWGTTVPSGKTGMAYAIYSSNVSAITAFKVIAPVFTFTSTSGLAFEYYGTAKAVTDALQITNKQVASDMDGTGSAIKFNQYYYHATAPVKSDAGKIVVATETDWTSTASTRDAYMSFAVALDGALTERVRITSSGNVGIGTTTPTYQFETSRTVKAGTALYANTRALDFDGDNDYVSLGDITEQNSATNFTMTVWVKQDVVPSTDYIFYRSIDANNNLLIYTASSVSRLYIHVGNGSNSYAYISNYSNYISAGHWCHIAVVYDGSGATNSDRLKLYIDGSYISFNGFSGTIPATTPNFASVPARISASATAWDGQIQDFRIYSSSLSASDILTIYQGGTYTTNMVHQYKLMEGSGTTAIDTGSNPLNGTIYGAVWSTTNNNAIQTDFGRGALTLAPNTTNAKDGIWFGYDVNLYRAAADTLKTDNSLVVSGSVTVGDDITAANCYFDDTKIRRLYTTTWFVPPTVTLASAISAASSGDTLVLSPGTWTLTSTLTINKSLTIVGQGKDMTTIYHSGSVSPMIDVTASNVTLRNLSLQWEWTGATGGTRSTVRVYSGSVGVALSGFVMENVHISSICSTDNSSRALLVYQTDVRLTNCSITLNSAVTTAAYTTRAIYLFQDASSSVTQESFIDNVVVSSDHSASHSGETTALCVEGLGSGTMTINLNSACRLTSANTGGGGSTTIYGIHATGAGTIVNVRGSYIQAVSYELIQASSATMNVFFVNLRNGLISGTITYLGQLRTNNAYIAGDTSHVGNLTMTGRLIHRQVNDSGPMTATNGTAGEIVFNIADSKFYGCTVTGTPATWAALH